MNQVKQGLVMCGDSTLLEPCQGETWKVKGWVFWGQDTGTKREASWKLCFGRGKSNRCMYYSRYHSIWWFSFFSFFYFIFYSLNFFLRKSWYETQVTSAGTVEETGYESPQTSKMKTTVLQIILEAPWPCTCNPLYFVHILWLNKLMRCFFRVLWHDVTAAILCSKTTLWELNSFLM